MKRFLKAGVILFVGFVLMACSLTEMLVDEPEVESPVGKVEVVEPAQPAESTATEPTVSLEPTSMPVIHWIAYESGGNIWVVDPDSGQYQQLTFDGSTETNRLRYSTPLVSPDGLYVAFSSRGDFHVYSFELQEIHSITMASPPDMLADMMLGWGEDGMLYYTRTMGVCDLSVTPMKGPDSVDIMRFDPAARNAEKIGEIPTIDEQSHAYSIGKSITPSGRYVTAYNAACSVGYGSTFVYDIQNQTHERNLHGSAEISNNGLTLAYVDDSNLETANFTQIKGIDRATGAERVLYKPQLNGYVVTDIRWSPDDAFIAFLEWPVLDAANVRGMGGFVNLQALDDPYLVIVDVKPEEYTADTSETYFVPEDRHMMGAWSPDGTRIVYTQWDEGGDMYGPGALMIYDRMTNSATFFERQEGLKRPDW